MGGEHQKHGAWDGDKRRQTALMEHADGGSRGRLMSTNARRLHTASMDFGLFLSRYSPLSSLPSPPSPPSPFPRPLPTLRLYGRLNLLYCVPKSNLSSEDTYRGPPSVRFILWRRPAPISYFVASVCCIHILYVVERNTFCFMDYTIVCLSQSYYDFNRPSPRV